MQNNGPLYKQLRLDSCTLYKDSCFKAKTQNTVQCTRQFPYSRHLTGKILQGRKQRFRGTKELPRVTKLIIILETSRSGYAQMANKT
jgi:hypothetical protein